MTGFVFISIYLAVILFAAGCIRRVVQYSHQPMHLRWELYPVPHESPDKVAHGGSYFEDGDWWTKPRRRNTAGELSVMIPEMLFMKALWEFNRGLWYISFPFHFGLYLIIGACGFALLGSAGSLAGSAAVFVAASALARVMLLAGAALACAGGVALFIRRASDKNLANYTTFTDYINVGASSAAAGLILLARLGAHGPSFAAFVKALLTFDVSLHIPGVLAAGVVLSAALAAYVPYTHMAHFIAKYFTYHAVRWDDTPNRGQKKMAAQIAEYLSYRPTWAARHVGADGTKTWAQIATTNPVEAKHKVGQ